MEAMEATEATEALQPAGRGAVLSHGSAALALGFELVDPGPATLTVPRNRSRLVLPDWRVVRADVPPEDLLARADLLPMTSAARTVRDLARLLPLDEAVAAADSALGLGLVRLERLQGALVGAAGRGAARPRQVASLLDPASGSVLESLLRVLLAYRRDRERLNELERLGWRVLRFTWEDVRSRREHVLALVRACLAPAA